MIICHTHRFIFIKTRKTAGTSIEGALAQLCGPNDVITSDGRPETQEDFYVEEARNYEGRFNPARELIRQDSLIGLARVVRDWSRRPKFYNHMAASSVMARVEPAVWSSYYKFCFERNPWDKMVSYYYFVHRGREPTESISDYILNKPRFATVDQHYCTDWSRYAIGDRIIVDDIFDFADIEGGLRTGLARAGVPKSVIAGIDIPRLKSRTRKERGVITQAASKRIAEIFARETQHFGYRVPEDMVEPPTHLPAS